MQTANFVAIGSKGTSFPLELKPSDIKKPLQIGENRLNYSAGPYKVLASKAHAFVSKRLQPFLLLPLEEALQAGLVIAIPSVAWKARAKLYQGVAFLNPNLGADALPHRYVAVQSPRWPYARVEQLDNGSKGLPVVATFTPTSIAAMREALARPTPTSIRSSNIGAPQAEANNEELLRESASDEDRSQDPLVQIQRRRGQAKFRKQLLDAYGGRCAISGCKLIDLLEAAHINGYDGPRSNRLENGLLLRADLHTLFDLHLICVDPSTHKLLLSDKLRTSEYAQFNGAPVTFPASRALWPSQEALQQRADDFLRHTQRAPLDSKR